MRLSTLALVTIFAAPLAGCASSVPAPEAGAEPTLTAQASGVDVLLIAAYAVDERVVWASGASGTVVRTLDGGETWGAMVVPGAEDLQFRDIHAWDDQSALILSIGTGTDSRVYRTGDGGSTWVQTFLNDNLDAFYDCFAFWGDAGLLFSDSVDGVFPIQRTTDGGRTWTLIPAENLPAAQEAEGSFASSGTCVATSGESSGWIATGNGATPRVLRTTDRGASWTATALPLEGGEASGGASIAFGRGERAVIVGGNIGAPEAFGRAVAMTEDGGDTWTEGGRLPFTGALYGAAFVPGSVSVVGVGPGGVALSRDAGATWAPLASDTHWGLAMAGAQGWLVGPKGSITHVRF